MSETEVVLPTSALAAHTEVTLGQVTKNISDPQVDGAHTQPIVTNNAEPVVIAAPDSGTSDVNAQLLNPTEGGEHNNNQPLPPLATTNAIIPETSVSVNDIQPTVNATPLDTNTTNTSTNTSTNITTNTSEITNTTGITNTTDEIKANSASASNANTHQPKSHHQHVSEVKSELRSSARNLRNSVLGIEEIEEVDENGVRVIKKIKRKERSHSRIAITHKKNLIGETIFKGHQSWVLMLNIQTGIRNAVGRGHSRSTIQRPLTLSPSSGSVAQTQKPETPPTPKYPGGEALGPESFASLAEFYASPGVLNFPSGGSSQTIPHETGPFKFKDYAPHAFRFLRHRFGIDTADYMVSLCNTQKNGERALRELPTPGKSGSLFFFSHDMRFILKTIPKSEAKLLLSLLPSYVDHIAGDENTLLPKFFGLHRVKPHRGRQVRFLVMNNVFQTRKVINERYDLKGSTLGRAASEEEKKKDTVTYKDLDFRERNMRIQIGPQKRIALLEQLHRDCKFLAKLNIMDYSLLVGIHNADKEDGWSGPPSPQMSRGPPSKLDGDVFHSIFQENDGGMKGLDEAGTPNGKFYYMGIIDILMLYSMRKKFEHTYKTLRYGKEEEISSISPNDYATRFYEFVAASIT